jgi:hypothetical protein
VEHELLQDFEVKSRSDKGEENRCTLIEGDPFISQVAEREFLLVDGHLNMWASM